MVTASSEFVGLAYICVTVQFCEALPETKDTPSKWQDVWVQHCDQACTAVGQLCCVCGGGARENRLKQWPQAMVCICVLVCVSIGYVWGAQGPHSEAEEG